MLVKVVLQRMISSSFDRLVRKVFQLISFQMLMALNQVEPTITVKESHNHLLLFVELLIIYFLRFS
jgi:hypothetical protein